ncbi:MAG: hypothetical protein JOZ05_17070, partial [Acetobacteraceae bacterium]|nr:hypothetical protein [Acetobacteraceae bacterium]
MYPSYTPFSTRTGFAALFDRPEPVSAECAARVAAVLADSGSRVVSVRPAAERTLSLPELIAQIVRQAPAHAPQDDWLECAFETLATPGPGFTRVTLLVANAQVLEREALEYLQFTCRSAPQLRLALLGLPRLRETLSGPGLAWLRERLAWQTPADRAKEEPVPAPVASAPVTRA